MLAARAPLAALSLASLLPLQAYGGDWTILPSVRVRQTYSDNLYLAAKEREHGDLVTELSPSVAIVGSGPRFSANAQYQVQQLVYTRTSPKLRHQLLGSANGELIDDWLHVEARASVSQRNLSAFGPQLVDPLHLDSNATDVRALSVSPVLRHRFNGVVAAEVRYRHDRIESGGGRLSTKSDSLGVSLVGDRLVRNVGWDLQYSRRTIDDPALAPVHLESGALSLRYFLDRRIALTASAGHESNDYVSLNSQPQGRSHAFGVSWTPSSRTALSASAGRRFFGDTYALDLRHQMRNSLWQLSYGEDITTLHSQVLNLPDSATAEFLHHMWASSIPDLAQRQAVIDAYLAYIERNGVGQNTFFSHRYFLQKRLAGSAALLGARNVVLFNLTRMDRTAQTASTVDLALLGQADLRNEDRTRHYGAHAGWRWRMSGRTDLASSAVYSHITSLTTGRTDSNLLLSVGMKRQLRARTEGAIDVRHVRHNSTRAVSYRENAISATLSMRF